MSKKKKDKDKKKQNIETTVASPELERLRAENEELRARLERIAELASTPIPSDQLSNEDEDAEYDELSRDVDDEIADDVEPEKEPATT